MSLINAWSRWGYLESTGAATAAFSASNAARTSASSPPRAAASTAAYLQALVCAVEELVNEELDISEMNVSQSSKYDSFSENQPEAL